MRKIIICDDESIIRQQLVLFLRNIEKEQAESFEIRCYSSGEELLERFTEDTEIILLDIKMKKLSGVDTARLLREKNQNVCIIFITSMIEYALDGYDVHAFGFITKPLQYDVFRRQITDALSMTHHHRGIPLTLKAGSETTVYWTQDILYFEIYGRNLNVVTKEDTRKFLIPLSKIEEAVKGQDFFRVHKSWLINLSYIKRIDNDSIIMINDDSISLSKHRKNEFLQTFARYIRRKQI